MSDAPNLAVFATCHDVPADVAATVLEALRCGGGGRAQFNHSAPGGMGQWSRGSGAMIGTMFDRD